MGLPPISVMRCIEGSAPVWEGFAMRMQHGRLSVDLPAGWADRSTLVFVGPQPTQPTVIATRVAPPSISITMVRAPAGAPRDAARAVLDDELAGLRAMGLGLEVLSIQDFDAALGPGAASLHKVTLDGMTLRQIHAVVIDEGIAVRAVAACGELDFPAMEQALRAALASLSLGAHAAETGAAS